MDSKSEKGEKKNLLPSQTVLHTFAAHQFYPFALYPHHLKRELDKHTLCINWFNLKVISTIWNSCLLLFGGGRKKERESETIEQIIIE